MNAGDYFVKRINGFIPWWVAMLWTAMLRTGRGYRLGSQRRDVRTDGRRPDKRDGTPKAFRQYRDRYTGTINGVAH